MDFSATQKKFPEAWLERPDGSLHWIDERTTIGRDPTNLLRVEQPTVSRAHALVECDGSTFRVVDRGSRHGTRVNGVVASPSLPLNDQDVIQLSPDASLVFRRRLDVPCLGSTEDGITVLSDYAGESFLVLFEIGKTHGASVAGTRAFVSNVSRVVRRHGGKVQSFWGGFALCFWELKYTADSSALSSAVELLQQPGAFVDRFIIHFGLVSLAVGPHGRTISGPAAEFCIAAADAVKNEGVPSVLTEAATRALDLGRSAQALRARTVSGYGDRLVFFTLGKDTKSVPGMSGRRSVVFAAHESPVFYGLSRAVAEDPRLNSVGFTSSPVQALSVARREGAELIVVDFSLPADLLTFARDVGASAPGVKVLAILNRADDELAQRALNSGYRGLVLSDEPVNQVLTAIHTVLLGNTYISPLLGTTLQMVRLEDSSARKPGVLSALTDREHEIFSLMGLGLQNSEISKKINVSVKTVETHVQNICNKMTVDGARELRLIAKKQLEPR